MILIELKIFSRIIFEDKYSPWCLKLSGETKKTCCHIEPKKILTMRFVSFFKVIIFDSNCLLKLKERLINRKHRELWSNMMNSS